MTALILKDIATLKKTLLLTIAISIALAVYGIYQNEIFMIPLICAMIPLILTAIAFGYDTKSKFEQFAFSLPIKKSSYVFSKLFFAFAFGLIGSVCSFMPPLFKASSSICSPHSEYSVCLPLLASISLHTSWRFISPS